jgi:hypothetical protein
MKQLSLIIDLLVKRFFCKKQLTYEEQVLLDVQRKVADYRPQPTFTTFNPPHRNTNRPC